MVARAWRAVTGQPQPGASDYAHFAQRLLIEGWLAEDAALDIQTGTVGGAGKRDGYPAIPYDQFVKTDYPAVISAYVQRNGHQPGDTDYAHLAWRLISERWTPRDMIHSIREEPLEDGGAGGAGVVQPGGGTAKIQGPIRVAGRSFTNDAGIFRPLFVSSFGTLSQVIHGDEAAAVAYMDWAVRTGFNGLRFFAGNLTWQDQRAPDALRVLPRALQLAKDRGLYCQVTALTDTGAGGFDKAAHVKACGREVGLSGNGLLEVANEPWHSSQDGDTHNVANLRKWGSGSPVPWACGAAGIDELDKPCNKGGVYPMAGGSWNQVHLRRKYDWPHQFARVREQEGLSGCQGVPVMNGEPLAWNETEQAGRRLNVPEAFYILGALTRLMEIGLVGHGEHALRSQIPGPIQQQCAEHLIAGVRGVDTILGTAARSTLKNGHWADAPATGRFVKEEDGEDLSTPNRVWRVTSGVLDNKAVVVLCGINGDPGLRFQAGWRPVRQLVAFPRSAVYEAAR